MGRRRERDRSWPPDPEPLGVEVVDNHTHLESIHHVLDGAQHVPTVAEHVARAASVVRGKAGDILAVEHDAAARGRKELGQKVEKGRLSRPVRADQGMDRAPHHLEAHATHRQEAREFLRKVARFQDHFTLAHRQFPPECSYRWQAG